MYLSVRFMRQITGKWSGSHSRQEAGSPQSCHGTTAYTGNMKKSPAVHPAGDFHHLPVHFFLYPHLGHTPSSSSVMPQSGQRSMSLWALYS